MKNIIALFLFIITAISAFATEPESVFIEANELYKSEQFQEAAEKYEVVLDKGYASGVLYYNLGNAYYKLENYSAAILNYERALKTGSDDEDIQFNLEKANQMIADEVQPVPELAIVTGWRNLVNTQSSKGWSLWALTLLWAAFIVFGITLFIRKRKAIRGLRITGAVVLVFSICLFTLAWQQYQAETSGNFAIIFAPTVYMKSSPDAGSTDLYLIHEGIKVEITDELEGWSEVRLADGKKGWVKQEEFRVI
ncbi:MAG: tetratricopeptide repeat protein [Bacteroidia bacterium]